MSVPPNLDFSKLPSKGPSSGASSPLSPVERDYGFSFGNAPEVASGLLSPILDASITKYEIEPGANGAVIVSSGAQGRDLGADLETCLRTSLDEDINYSIVAQGGGSYAVTLTPKTTV